jgi:acetylornithine deacetylase/succinyl-diaminopimelate desuccinylase-like protein
MRLVKGIDPAAAFARVKAHIEKQGYTVVDKEPDAATRMKYPRLAYVVEDPASYPASRTSMDLPISQLVLRTADAVHGPVVKLPTMGGSVPLYMITEILHAPTITVPIANHDNNQHSFNENIRVQNLWDGIELMSALLAM